MRNVRLKKSNSVWCILRQRVLVSARAYDRVSVRVCVSGRLKSPRKVKMTSRQMYMCEYVKNGKRDTIAQRCGERSKEGERGGERVQR